MKNTEDCYGVGFRYWTQFCRRNQLDEAAPSSVNLINFLQFEYEVNKRQYRTINTYRSAVSSTLGTCPRLGTPIGQDPLVCRFMRGLHRLRPPRTKLFPNWEIVKVLNQLLTWGEAKQLSLRNLSIKTAFLVAIVCYKRPSDLCNMQVVENYWQLDMMGFTCQPLGYGKTESHNPTPPIRIEPFLKDPRLCPVYHLVRLEKILRKLRSSSETRFWLSSKQPHQAITPSTMCGWLKEVISASGSLHGTARDVRSVGATTAVQARLDIKQIMEAANWQRLTTLQRHYFKPQPIQSLSSILKGFD